MSLSDTVSGVQTPMKIAERKRSLVREGLTGSDRLDGENMCTMPVLVRGL